MFPGQLTPPDSLELELELPSKPAGSASAKQDQTLKLLKKYYLEALLAQQADCKLPYHEQNVSSLAFFSFLSLKYNSIIS